MSKFQLIHETPSLFVLHNGVSHFHIAKNGISEPTADKIRSFAEGGKVERNPDIDTEPKDMDSTLPAIPSSDDIYTPTELPEAEKPEKRREIEVDMPEPTAMAEGGKLSASDRKHITPKNFAGPDRSYPIEDASHARNALARVSQHGSPELKAQVRAKVHSKYPGIEQSHAEGGSVPYRKPQKYDDGGEVQDSNITELGNSIKQAFKTPDQSAQRSPASDQDRDAEYAKIRQQNTENMKGGGYAEGGAVESNKVQDISNETQSQAIKRYAAGNPANLAEGGYIHHNAGKNQVHLHFYDGGIPQQPTTLDKYVGGEPGPTPLDNYVNLADPSGTVGEEASSQNVPTDSDKLAQAAQDLQAGLNSQTPPANSPTTTSTPDTSIPQTVPAAQQIPAVQKPLSPTPDQSPSMLSDFDKSLAMEKSGIEQGAAAQTKGYQDTAQAIGQNVLQQKQQMDAYKLEADKITQQNTQLFNAVASSKVDPNHFWNSKSTGGKIMSTIGVLLGGIGGGASGTNQNQALTTLQNHIQQDIEAQKNDQSNKMNLYKMGLERYRDAQSAQQFATLQSNALLQGTLQKIAAQTGAPQAQATAQQMIGQLGVQNAGIRSELAMKQAAFGAMNQTQPANAGVDPNKMRLLINAGVIPKEEVPAAMKEYGDYQKLGTILDDTDKTFDIGRKNANWRQAILPHWTPDITQASKQYDAAIDGFLGKITKETEGRVTPADVELMRPSMPSMTDSPETAQQKLNTIKDQIREKYAFPTLQSYRLLHPNNTTSTSSATRQKRFTESKPR